MTIAGWVPCLLDGLHPARRDTATGQITGKPTMIGEGTAVITSVEGAGVRGATAFTWIVVHGPIIGPDNKCVDDQQSAISPWMNQLLLVRVAAISSSAVGQPHP